LINRLFDAGLVQFGLFDDAPMRLMFDMLCSYPQLRRDLATNLVRFIEIEDVDHLVCMLDSICIATTASDVT
jgi:hypothetical protein